MANKKRGIAVERELLHMLWDAGFACCRVAGSGSIPEPSCDLLAGNTKAKYAIEVKSSKTTKKYIQKKQVNEFMEFANKFGLTPLIALKFSRKGWHFLTPDQFDETNKAITISLEKAQKIGTKFEELTQI